MAHGITDTDRVVSANNVPMWHRLGEIVRGKLTKAEALDRLNWTVERTALLGANGIAFPEKVGLYRSDTRQPLAVVGTQYTAVQNKAAVDFLFDVVDASGGDAIVETAGSIFGGKRIWFLVRVPKDIRIGGKDEIVPYMLVANGHDGVMAFHCRPSAVRVVCNNTLNAAIGSAGADFKVKHTESITGRLAEARKALGITFKYYDAFAELMEQMAERKVSDARFEKIVQAFIPVPDPKPEDFRREQERERAAKARLALLKVWATSTTVDRGTAFGAYNAITEYTDHVKDATQSGVKTPTAVETKVNKLWFGSDAADKQRGLALILAK